MITILPTPIYNRRDASLYVDSLGRLFMYGVIFDNSIHDFDATATGAPAERYDPTTLGWTALPFSSEAVQGQFGEFFSSDQFNRICGQYIGPTATFTRSQYMRTYEVYDTASNGWSSGGSLPVNQERVNNVAWLEGGTTPYTVGGASSGGANTTTGKETYKYTGGTWSRMTDAPHDINHLAVLSFGHGFIQNPPPFDSLGRRYFCYYNSNTQLTVAFDRYTPSTDTWETLTTGSSPYTITAPMAYGSDGSLVNNRIYFPAAAIGVASGWVAYDVVADTWVRLADRPTAQPGLFIYHARTNSFFQIGTNYSNTNPNFFSGEIYQYDVTNDVWTDTGDAISRRSLALQSSVTYDGIGIYIGPGKGLAHDANALDAVNIVEYFVPGSITKRRSFMWASGG